MTKDSRVNTNSYNGNIVHNVYFMVQWRVNKMVLQNKKPTYFQHIILY